MQEKGALAKEDRSFLVLTPRSEMTGADRGWAARYEAGDVLHYSRGSKSHSLEAGSYAQVVTTNPPENLVTVKKSDGELLTYDPSRLRASPPIEKSSESLLLEKEFSGLAERSNRNLIKVSAIEFSNVQSPASEIVALHVKRGNGLGLDL